MSKEVYRSFEGKLDVDCRDGYIILELKDFWEIRFLTVDGSDDMVRIRKEFLSENDFSNRDKINDLYVSIYFNWGDFGQCWFNGKWYGYDTICKIQRKNKDDKISKEFYYLGRVNATGQVKEFVMPNTDKTAVEIEWVLDTPVREDIYEYIVNG